MNWLINRKITSSFTIALCTLLVIGVSSYCNFLKLRESTKRVEHTHQILIKSEELIASVQEAEIQQREYLLTANHHYLTSYNNAVDSIYKIIKNLEYLTQYNLNHEQRIAQIKLLIKARVELLNETIIARQEQGFNTALKVVHTGKGKRVFDQIKTVIKDIEAEENNLLQQRSEQENSVAQITNILVISGSCFAFVIVAWASWLVNRDILERQQVEQAQKDSEERFRQLAENIREVFWIDTLEHQQLYVSPAYKQIWGQSCESLYAEPKAFLESIHPEDRERVIAAQKKQILGEYDEEYRIIRPDGETRWIRDRAFPIRNEQGEIYRIVGIAEDISDRKGLEVMLRQQTEQLEQANRMKDEFLAVTSHELRTPLSAILTWAQLLRKRNLDAATTARALETIERNARSQNQLIEDLLDISRIIRGKIRLDFSTINLIEVINAAIDTVSSAAAAKSIQLESIFTCSECTVDGDSMRLQQVVWNLLSNAIKFTPSGGRVEVRLSVVEEDERTRGRGDAETRRLEIDTEGKDDIIDCHQSPTPIQNPKSKIQNYYAQVQVIDTGKGIDGKFLPYIFERFSQAEDSSTRRSKGLGLGLAIAHQLVELHGGTLTADSAGEGQGATFTIYLPIIVQTSEKFTANSQFR